MTQPHWNEVSRATCEQLLAAVDAAERSHPLPGVSGVAEVMRRARREARPPLRTRAEVDQEIAGIVRDRHGKYACQCADCIVLNRLSAEPFAPDPDPNHTDVIQCDEPEPCSCEEALALRDRLQRIKAVLQGERLCYADMPAAVVDTLDALVRIASGP